MAIIKTIKVGSTTYDINDSRIADLPLSISQGGTGATTKALAQTALDIDEMLNLGVSASTLISTGTDLDSLTTVGSYYTAGSSATVLNSPAGADAHGYTGGFRLYVMIANASYLHQIFIPSASNEIWIRRKSNSTTWGAWENINNDTDEKVKQTVVSSGTSKYPILVKETTNTTTATEGANFGTNLYALPANAMIAAYGVTGAATDNGSGFAVRNNTGVKTVAKLYTYQDGTSTSVGAGALYLGNTDATPTVGNARGQLYIASEGAARTRIQSQATSNRNVELPDATGWVAVGGDGSSSGEGGASTPIYMDTNGELKPVTSINSSLYTDELVKQTETDGSNFYPILTTATSVGSASGTLTGSARYNTGVRIAHGKGTVISEATAGSMIGVNSGGFKVNNATTMVAGMWHAVEGTASAVGYGSAALGNSTPSGTAGNAAGRIYVYGTGTGRNLILSNVTNASTPTNYLPNADGYLAVGDTAGVGSKTVPVYMSSSGVLTAITGSSLFATFTGATSTTGYSITAKVAGQERTVTIPGASSSQAGLVTTGAQTFAGAKTYVTTVYFGNTNIYYASGAGNGSFNNLRLNTNGKITAFTVTASGTTTTGTSLVFASRAYFADKIIGKSGTATSTGTGNYTTSVPSATNGVPTGQIMFVIQ